MTQKTEMEIKKQKIQNFAKNAYNIKMYESL